MINPLKILKNMGFRYTTFRLWYEFIRRSGIQKLQYPTSLIPSGKISLDEWRVNKSPFFFKDRNDITKIDITNDQKRLLKGTSKDLINGKVVFFSGKEYDLGKSYDWLTNPLTDYRYNRDLHWTKINDIDSNAGDIKFVWEKSRFSYLYSIIRNDLYNNEDHSEFVFSEILNWIDINKLNCGPNFKCSQEIALRVLNWIFFLHFYSQSDQLNEDIFQKIMSSIYGQIDHVEKNIDFSRIAVRNNHAITEALGLYTIGLLCPWFKESKRWKRKGRRYLEEEGLYQIYEDGSYIQHSFNYQRVVMQLYTWAISLVNVNGEQISKKLLARLSVMRNFLVEICNSENGKLPNHGPNDGALFFPLNNCDYRDFRGQINVFSFLLDGKIPYKNDTILLEDLKWFGTKQNDFEELDYCRQSYKKYNSGGYYTFNTHETFSFIRCATYKNRPYQADNLHLDLWYNGRNVIRDNGTYLYNGESLLVNYFSGTEAHNTVMIENYDQMKRAGRFIWYDWSKSEGVEIIENDEYIKFSGQISAFKQVDDNITHKRIFKVYKKRILWEIEDVVSGTKKEITQLWHISPEFENLGFVVETSDYNGIALKAEKRDIYYSNTYGMKEASKAIVFRTNTQNFKTKIYKR